MGMTLTDRSAIENIVIAQLGVPPASIYNTTSNLLPRVWWVAPGGADGVYNGYMTSPFLTIKRAIRQAVDGDIILVAPGSYAETIDIGSGDATSGSSSTNGYAKKGLKIIGCGGGHNGVVQIIGDGATAQASLRVRTDYLAGFWLKGLELDTNGLTQSALHLVTNNTASGSQSNPAIRFVVEDVSVRSNDPGCGIMLEGATLGIFRRLVINGPTIGIGFTGSDNNTPSDLTFEDVDFSNAGFSSTQTACIASTPNDTTFTAGSNAVGALTGVVFKRANFFDRGTGAGGGTNFINIGSGVTAASCGVYDANFATQPTNGTNKVATLPSNFIVMGYGTTGRVNLVG